MNANLEGQKAQHAVMNMDAAFKRKQKRKKKPAFTGKAGTQQEKYKFEKIFTKPKNKLLKALQIHPQSK